MRTAKGDVALADNVLQMLGERDWTQRELSRLSGVTNVTISNIVACRNGATLATVRKIREAFGCSWDELLG